MDDIKTRRELTKNINSGKWSVRSVKIGGVYKAVYYNVLRVIFDDKNKRVLNWFVCGDCRMVIYHNLNAIGSKSLHKHQCVRDYKKRMKALESKTEEPERGLYHSFCSNITYILFQ